VAGVVRGLAVAEEVATSELAVLYLRQTRAGREAYAISRGEMTNPSRCRRIGRSRMGRLRNFSCSCRSFDPCPASPESPHLPLADTKPFPVPATWHHYCFSRMRGRIHGDAMADGSGVVRQAGPLVLSESSDEPATGWRRLRRIEGARRSPGLSVRTCLLISWLPDAMDLPSSRQSATFNPNLPRLG